MTSPDSVPTLSSLRQWVELDPTNGAASDAPAGDAQGEPQDDALSGPAAAIVPLATGPLAADAERPAG